MGLWREQVVPRATDVLLGTPEVRSLRQEALATARGTVVEVGFGSGSNVPFYPPAVRTLLAVEPSAVALRLAAERIRAASMAVELIGPDARELPLESSSVDGAVSTFTLCTVPDAARALEELARVLRPGGTFHFVEHGLSPVPSVAAWQRRLNPLQRRIAAGCTLDRPIDRLVTDAGLVVEQLRTVDLRGPAPIRPYAHIFCGVASKAGPRPAPPPARQG